ncbi:MAG: 16S rRNA processing protein RimM [Sulfurospirillum sp.]|nr:16S rRNA processing protein RimM [Sulfurospirillum sp.]
MNYSDTSQLEVAQIGRLVGLRGELKLHIHSDFPEQFKKGKIFTTQKNISLQVHSFNLERSLVSFVGYLDRQLASSLVNSFLFSSVERSLQDCHLQKDEFFWFELIAAQVYDGVLLLGVVTNIERIANVNYLVIQTDAALLQKGHVGEFYIPYISRFVDDFSKEKKIVSTHDTYGLLENS